MNLTRLLQAILLSSSLIVAALPASAQAIWKWRDKDGRMQISDRAPPVEVPDRDILQRPGGANHAAAQPAPAASASAATADAAPAVETELEARKRKAAQELAAQKQAKLAADNERQAGQKAETCRRARAQMAMIDSGQRIVRPTASGEREVLDDQGRAEEAQRTRQLMQDNCQ